VLELGQVLEQGQGPEMEQELGQGQEQEQGQELEQGLELGQEQERHRQQLLSCQPEPLILPTLITFL
jgi:hypothetical protein